MIVPRPSPNKRARPPWARPEIIVIHGTVGSDAGDLAWLTNPESGVSYHYVIVRAGQIYQLVEDNERAAHAGRSEWGGRPNTNDFSIGVGISNRGPRDGNPEPYSEEQYKATGALCAMLMARWSVPVENIVGHHTVSPGRKTDPWLHFEWMRLVSHLHIDIGVTPDLIA